MSDSKTRELQALLKQKDTELEDRGKLLYKTKLAIEQLQQELAASRRDEEAYRSEARKGHEEQAAQIRSLQEQLRSCQDELEARSSELSQSAADAQTRQARMRDLDEARQSAEAEAASLAEKLRDTEDTLASAREDMESQAGQLASLQRLLQDRTSQIAALKQDVQHLEKDREEAAAALREAAQRYKRLQGESQGLGDNLQEAQAEAHQAKDACTAAEARVSAGAERLVKSEQQWRAKLHDLEALHAANLKQALLEADTRVESVAAEHTAQRTVIEQAWRLRLETAESRSAEMLETTKSDLQAQLQGLEWTAATERALIEKQLASKLETAEARWAAEKAGAEKAWARAKEDAAREWASALAGVRQTAAAELALVRQQYEQERAAAEVAWARRAAAAAGSLEALGCQVEGKLAGLTGRLRCMAKKQAKRDARCGVLLKRLEEAEVMAHTEAARRVELEAALQEAAGLFRRELMDKNHRLSSFQAEVRNLRAWQKQASAFLERRRRRGYREDHLAGAAASDPDHVDAWPRPPTGREQKPHMDGTAADSRRWEGREVTSHSGGPQDPGAEVPVQKQDILGSGPNLLRSMSSRLAQAAGTAARSSQRSTWRIPAIGGSGEHTPDQHRPALGGASGTERMHKGSPQLAAESLAELASPSWQEAVTEQLGETINKLKSSGRLAPDSPWGPTAVSRALR